MEIKTASQKTIEWRNKMLGIGYKRIEFICSTDTAEKLQAYKKLLDLEHVELEKARYSIEDTTPAGWTVIDHKANEQ